MRTEKHPCGHVSAAAAPLLRRRSRLNKRARHRSSCLKKRRSPSSAATRVFPTRDFAGSFPAPTKFAGSCRTWTTRCLANSTSRPTRRNSFTAICSGSHADESIKSCPTVLVQSIDRGDSLDARGRYQMGHRQPRDHRRSLLFRAGHGDSPDGRSRRGSRPTHAVARDRRQNGRRACVTSPRSQGCSATIGASRAYACRIPMKNTKSGQIR